MARRGTIPERLWRMVIANFGTKVVSVVIAVVLWGIVLGSRNVEVTKEIPLEVITPSDIVPANEIPDRIAFRLSGPKAFLRSILDRREEPIRVNLSGAKPALVTYRFFSDNIRVPIGVKVLSINPTAILIKLEYLKRKDVPVRVELRGTPPEGFRVVKTEIRPEIVRIKGAESRVDSMTEIATTPIDVSNLKKNFDKEIPIDLTRFNVQLDSPLPHVYVEVEPISANFRIKNVDIQVLSSYKVRLEEKSVTVLVRASPQDLQSLDRSQVFGVMDLSGKAKGKYSEPVKVTLPKNISLVRVVPDRINVVLY
jgi:YbbR domain-containing protein